MKILAEAWPAWTERIDLVKAAKRVGISESGTLNAISCRKLVRDGKGSSEYYRLKLESVEKKVAEHMQFESSDVKGILAYQK